MRADREEQAARAVWTVLSGLGFLAGGLELLTEVLRETPAFWTNAGGYPLWMRAAARDGFFPVLFLSVVNLGGLVWLLIGRPLGTRRELRRRLASIAGIAALLLLTVAVGLYDEPDEHAPAEPSGDPENAGSGETAASAVRVQQTPSARTSEYTTAS